MNPATLLDKNSIAYRTYHHDETFDAQHMAQSMHVSGRKVAKAVMVSFSNGKHFVVLVVPAPERVELQRVAEIVAADDVRLATEPEMLGRCGGDCELGVVPIFGSLYGLQTIVDESLANQDEFVFQSNTHTESIRMRFADYYALEHPRIATIIQQRRKTKMAS